MLNADGCFALRCNRRGCVGGSAVGTVVILPLHFVHCFACPHVATTSTTVLCSHTLIHARALEF